MSCRIRFHSKSSHRLEMVYILSLPKIQVLEETGCRLNLWWMPLTYVKPKNRFKAYQLGVMGFGFTQKVLTI